MNLYDPSMRPPRPALLIVNFDSARLLRDNIVPLTREMDDLLTVVVDNYSNERARREVEQLCRTEGWTLHMSDVNDGFGAGMNRAAAIARGMEADILMLLNPDARMTVASARELISVIERAPLSLVAPTVLRSDGSLWFGGGTLDLVRGRTLSRPCDMGSEDELPWLSGACLITTTKAWQMLSGFDEDYFLYWEDVDLSYRALSAGLALDVLDTVEVLHDEGGTQGGDARNPLSWDYYYYNIRNRLLFARKWLAPRDRRRWYRKTLFESYRILLRGTGKRIFLRPWRPLICAVRAIVDGLTMERSEEPRPH